MLLAGILLMAAMGLGCENRTEPAAQAPHRAGEQSVTRDGLLTGYRKQVVQPVGPETVNPLARAMALVGYDPAGPQPPHFSQAGYNLIGNLPIVDLIQETPLAMPAWAEARSRGFQQMARQGFGPLLAGMMGTLDHESEAVSNTPPAKSGAAGDLLRCLESASLRVGANLAPDVEARIAAAGLRPQFDAMLGALVEALIVASAEVEEALVALSPDERRLLKETPERFFFPDGDFFKFLTADTHRQVERVRIAQRIDFSRLFAAALQVGHAVDRFVREWARLEKRGAIRGAPADDTLPQSEILNLQTPIGPLVVLGAGNDRFSGEAALLVDLGGDDRYEPSPPELATPSGHVTVHIDLGGNDSYGGSGHKFRQGTGYLSIGLMLDLDGDDEYQAGDMGQGCGLFGVGLLMDLKGNDIYRMGLMGQGFGLFGLGALADMEGNDRYLIKGMGQGAGATLGLGLLIDGAGNDKYLAGGGKRRSRLVPDSMNHCQGAGLSIRSHIWAERLSIYGGIGFLSDGGGDDFYHAAGGNCMGSSYFMSLGALVDQGGNDTYMPEGGYGMGFGLHLSNGALVDVAGDDLYMAGAYCGGFGSDRSVGILTDAAGNDIYGPSDRYVQQQLQKENGGETTTGAAEDTNAHLWRRMADTSYGAALKPKALGILADFQGRDQYFANPLGKGVSVGGVVPPVDPRDWSHGIAVDWNGNDRYHLPGRQNAHFTITYGHGICYDTDAEAKGGVSMLFASLQPNRGRSSPSPAEGATPVHSFPVIETLARGDLWQRFRAKGRLLQNRSETIRLCAAILQTSTDRRLNRELFEVLNQLLIESNGQREAIEGRVVGLLSAADPQVRLLAVYLAGWQRLKSANAHLLAICGQDDANSRPAALWALGRLAAPESVGVLVKFSRPGMERRIRHAAYDSMAKLAAADEASQGTGRALLLETLAAGLDDPDPVIRLLAASGLRPTVDAPRITKKMEALLEDENVYVRRAAARALAFKGNPRGIPILIASLRFPSIDTFEHYDHEIAKDLSYLCGVDFDGDNRYQYDTWRQWWEANSRLVDLERNLEIKAQIETAFGLSDLDAGVAIFEQLATAYPDNVVVRQRYIRFCREWITFRLLNQAPVPPAAIEKAIGLQRKLMLLAPENKLYAAQMNYLEQRLATAQSPDVPHAPEH